jgi:glycine/serine hydroxymethyltransferase
MKEVARLMARVIAAPTDAGVKSKVKAEAEALCAKFPLYPELGEA